jgi:hypothetical protein
MGLASEGAIDLLTTSLEMPQTIRMFVDLFRRVHYCNKAGHALRRMDMRSYRRYIRKAFPRKTYNKFWEYAKQTSNVWLEYRYGWRNLYFDAVNAVKALSAIFSPSSKQQSTYSWREFRPGHTSSIEDLEQLKAVQKSEAEPLVSVSTIHQSQCELRFDWWGKVALSSGFGLDGVKLYTVLQRIDRAIGSMDIPRAAWETTRLSWIVDAFIDLGSVVGATGLSDRDVSRQWNTLSIPQTDSNVTITREFYSADMSTLLATPHMVSLTPWPVLQTLWEALCYPGAPWQSDDLSAVSITDGTGSMYMREVPLGPLHIQPLKVPYGPLITANWQEFANQWAKVLDIVAVLVTGRKIR